MAVDILSIVAFTCLPIAIEECEGSLVDVHSCSVGESAGVSEKTKQSVLCRNSVVHSGHALNK